jgi:hypothetical protein
MQLRDARSESSRHDDSVKRLRLLLAQARAMLREQGVSFMEEDASLDALLATSRSSGTGHMASRAAPAASGARTRVSGPWGLLVGGCC